MVLVCESYGSDAYAGHASVAVVLAGQCRMLGGDVRYVLALGVLPRENKSSEKVGMPVNWSSVLVVVESS